MYGTEAVVSYYPLDMLVLNLVSLHSSLPVQEQPAAERRGRGTEAGPPGKTAEHRLHSAGHHDHHCILSLHR